MNFKNWLISEESLGGSKAIVYHGTSSSGIQGIVSSGKFKKYSGNYGNAVYTTLQNSSQEDGIYSYDYLISAHVDLNGFPNFSYDNNLRKQVYGTDLTSEMLKKIFGDRLTNEHIKDATSGWRTPEWMKFWEGNCPGIIFHGKGMLDWVVIYHPEILKPYQFAKAEQNIKWLPAKLESLQIVGILPQAQPVNNPQQPRNLATTPPTPWEPPWKAKPQLSPAAKPQLSPAKNVYNDEQPFTLD